MRKIGILRVNQIWAQDAQATTGDEGAGGEDGDHGGVELNAGMSAVAGVRRVAGCKDGEAEASDVFCGRVGALQRWRIR